jgi:adenosylcobinamide kinase / adenosylcobinamide-phosphate guanylyltransferase
MRTLVLGGIRSGKSRWAEDAIAVVAGPGAPVCYLATATPGDDAEWSTRISSHLKRRPAHWTTVEDNDVAAQLRGQTSVATLVDDVGNWLTAAMDRHGAWEAGNAETVASFDEFLDDLVSAVEQCSAPLVLVSPEVGLTVVPATPAGRRFADALGMLNQRLAGVCDRVVLVVAGLAVTLKPTGLR